MSSFQGEGKVFKVTFEAAAGESKVVEVPDNVYILDAAEKAGLDLPNTCRGESKLKQAKEHCKRCLPW